MTPIGANADKRRAVTRLLTDDEWGKWSDRKIAEQCGVSADLVGDTRRSLSFNDSDTRTYTTRHGTTATMNVANIGAKKEPVAVTFGTPNTDDEPTAVKIVSTL